MANTHIKLEILDPSRWYLSYAKIRKHYVQIHSSEWSDPDFIALLPKTKLLFIWLKNASLRHNNAVFSVCLESILPVFNDKLTKISEIKGMLKELKDNNIIGLQSRLSVPIEENRIEEKKREANQRFDLDLIYSKYPRKQGKKSGLEKLSKIVTSDDMYKKILHGAEKYADYHAKMKTDKQFIKQFSAWVNQECWDDELDFPAISKIVLPSDMEQHNEL